MGRSLLIIGAWILAISSARADQVYLHEGRVLEGTATIQGDKVVIALESGSITVPLHEVSRIERAVTPLAQANAREAALKPSDVRALLQLADFCRDHDLLNKERDLLARIIALSPDHAEARRRLGFARIDGVWVDRAELSRRDQANRLEHRQAQVALEQKEAELRIAEAKLAEARSKAQQQAADRQREDTRYSQPPYSSYGGYGYGPYGGYGSYGGYAVYGNGRVGHLTPPSAPPAFGINGVRSPNDMGFNMPGVMPPSHYFDGALRR
jgi:hypothetical protein